MIQDIFPSANEALALEPEELGVFLIRHLSELESKNQASSLHLGNYFVSQDVSDYCESVSNRQMTHAITEAWIWLEREGMLAPRVEHGRDWVYVTKRGHQLLEEQNWESYRRGNLLRKVNLAPALARKVLPMFLRGDYEPAIFQAFKEVEVKVRQAAELPGEKIGVPLMREAFNVDHGPLSDLSSESGERQAISDLFAGAIGTFKSPSSHRDVEWNEPQEAAEAILLANHLLRLVEHRVSQLANTRSAIHISQ